METTSSSLSSRAHKANRNFPIRFVAKRTVGVTMVGQIKAIRLEQTKGIFWTLRTSYLTSSKVCYVDEIKFMMH